MPPLTSLLLGRVLRNCLSSSSSASSSQIRSNTFSPRLATIYFPNLQFLSRSFSSQEPQSQDLDPVALSISTELLQSSNTDPLSVSERLNLNFSHITPTSSLVLQTLNLSPDAGRTVLGFHQWLVSSADFKHTDDTLSFFIDYFGRRKDFKATDEILAAGKGVAGDRTLESLIDRLVRAGRPTQVVGFFDGMEREYGFKRDTNSLKMVAEKLCENGYASNAEKMVKSLANVIFPDEVICDLLIKGWCVDGKLDEAKRLAGEMNRGGFEIGIKSYNAILDCVCKLCRQKDPFRLQSEAGKVLLDMETYGVPRNVETYNVLISNLCKIRKTEDAMNLFYRMGEWGCYPDETTFIVLIRSLYQAARISEGDEMIDRMKSAGYGDKLDKKAYYGFLKILCGIERLEHAMTVFKKMKDDGCKPGIKTYDLLMGKWCSLKRVDKANALFHEASKNGVPVIPKEYRVDPRFLKKPKVDENKKQRETLPEKMARKRRRLKQIRLSFVKKPRNMMRRAI